MFDTTGNTLLLSTPELGFGSPAPGTFARFVAGTGTTKDLLGPGFSISGSFGGGSASFTFPFQSKDCVDGEIPGGGQIGSPIVEFGIGSPGISATEGVGVPIWQSDILGDIGRWLGNALYDGVN